MRTHRPTLGRVVTVIRRRLYGTRVCDLSS